MSRIKNAYHDEIVANALEREGHRVLTCACGMRVCEEEAPCDNPHCILNTVNKESNNA